MTVEAPGDADEVEFPSPHGLNLSEGFGIRVQGFEISFPGAPEFAWFAQFKRGL